MPTLLLKFIVDLKDYSLHIDSQRHGPLFHRWLPDNMRDAIIIDTKKANTKLKIWFERFGFVSGSFITFDKNRQEVNPDMIPLQAVLEAGPLMGLLEIQELSEDDLVPLRENKIGEELYVKIGKRVVKDLIYPSIARFINVLRMNYGQYWIRELEEWDSRNESLGNYCRNRLNLKYSLDNETSWSDFIPDKPISIINFESSFIPKKVFYEYLTKKDWQELDNTIQGDYVPSLGAIILSRTNQFSDYGNFRYAFIEGVNALEIAISEFFEQKFYGEMSLNEKIEAFKDMNLPAQVIALASTLDIPIEDIKNAVKAIDTRNKVVHEGKNPVGEYAKIELSGLLNVIKKLLTGPGFKFPKANPGNLIMSLEEWKKSDGENPRNV